MTLSRGSDSNVNQGASNPVFVTGSGADRIESLLSEDFLPKRDGYTQAAFDYTRELARSGGIGFAQLRTRRYDQLHDQDTNALLLGIDRPIRGAFWPASASASGSLVSLGGKVYQRQLQLQARTMPVIAILNPLELTLSAALGAGRIHQPQGVQRQLGRTGFDAQLSRPAHAGPACRPAPCLNRATPAVRAATAAAAMPAPSCSASSMATIRAN